MFAQPLWLLVLAGVIAMAVAYVLINRRRSRRAVAFGNMTVLAKVSGTGRPWVRHVPVVAMLVALALAAVALAGPVMDTRVAKNRATIILVVDVSLSMGATDVEPDRLTAAKQAGREFIESIPEDLNLGLVTFAGSTRTPVAPTTDHQRVIRALDGASLASATATGDAIMSALDSVDEVEDAFDGAEGPPPAEIVMLSDGKQTIPANLDDPRGAYTAADEAASRGVPVNTISFGTPSGIVSVGGDIIAVPNDDESLAEIARRSEGSFHSAQSLEELRDAYGVLSDDIGYEIRSEENPRPWLIAAFVALLVAVCGTLIEARRVP